MRRVGEINPRPPDAVWLVENIWLGMGVGILGGQPKAGKTYLAAEIALAVATGLHALGAYPTHKTGPVLFYGPEDGLEVLRSRFDDLAPIRGFDIDTVPVYLIEVPVLHLDNAIDLQRLRANIELCRPRLLILDPFVRLVGNIDENSASDVSSVLGSLRTIQREYEVGILVVHHARKSPAAHPNQAFRGSSDFAAWSDTNLFLARNAKRLVLSVEHRSAPSPQPINLRLEEQPSPHLVVIDAEPILDKQLAQDPLESEIRHHLGNAAHPLTTVELRDRLRRRKIDVVSALDKLRAQGVITRTSNGWQLITCTGG
jgi:hypothetical protein